MKKTAEQDAEAIVALAAERGHVITLLFRKISGTQIHAHMECTCGWKTEGVVYSDYDQSKAELERESERQCDHLEEVAGDALATGTA